MSITILKEKMMKKESAGKRNSYEWCRNNNTNMCSYYVNGGSNPMDRSYLAIDLKSFYASVECVERGLDPLKTHLVVADASRTEKTICLAVTPPLKKLGVPGRARLFEAIQKADEINAGRLRRAPGRRFTGKSYLTEELSRHPDWALDFLKAPPRMALYMEYSTRIYQIYLRHVAPEDIHVYSIDEVFMDVTPYLKARKMTARQFAAMMIREVYEETGITAAAGVGTNLYLCKVAMDIVAKHVAPDENGVRIAELNELSYRKMLWTHRPLTDFWRVGGGYARKLEQNGLFTMGDVARCSLDHREEMLYRLFGVNAELLIDHAWGWEPCTMQDIKSYRPSASSMGMGQVLQCPYPWEKARLIVKEMTDQLALDLVDKRLVTDQLVLTIGYDIENLTDPEIRSRYQGPVTIDHYGRRVPKHSHGTIGLGRMTSSSRLISAAMMELFDRVANPDLLVRRINIVAGRVLHEDDPSLKPAFEQLDLFTNYEAEMKRREMENLMLRRERSRQEAVLQIRKRYGKNAILRGMNLEEGATARDRNRQIGGHKA